ncbi:interleukin-5 receptor subunit alpha-like [Mantella aurantiaca]
MMAYKEHVSLWILLLASVRVCYQIHVTNNTLNFFLKKPNIRIFNNHPNAVNLTWDTEEPSELDEYEICYNFSYRFLDKKKWKKEILTENYRVVFSRLHPGFIASVSNAVCDTISIVSEGNNTEFVYHAPPVYISDVSCAIYNLTNLNCTWKWVKDAPLDVNYMFAIRLYDKTLACKKYLNRHGRNIGCHMKNVFPKQNNNEIQKIRVWFYNNVTRLSKTFRTSTIELLNAPINISVISVAGKTKLEWLSPPSVNPVLSKCYQYHIRVMETQTKKLLKNVIDFNREEYEFSDLDKDKNYSVQIRAKKIYCAKSKYWGEWSQPIFINNDKEIFPIWIIILIIASISMVIVFLLIYLFRRYVKILILVAIPDPSEKLKLSLSNNINAQRCIAVHNEQPVPISEIEIVSSLMDSQECQDSDRNI